MSWRESDQVFLKQPAWRMPWWIASVLFVLPLVALGVGHFWFRNFPTGVFAILSIGLCGWLYRRRLRTRAAAAESGCVWCLYPTLDAESRCPECGRVTTPANRDVARHMIAHGKPP
jgi:hypothetical protein